MFDDFFIARIILEQLSNRPHGLVNSRPLRCLKQAIVRWEVRSEWPRETVLCDGLAPTRISQRGSGLVWNCKLEISDCCPGALLILTCCTRFEANGKNDGSVQGKPYFRCKPKYGVFVRPSQVRNLEDDEPLEDGSISRPESRSISRGQTTVSEQITLPAECKMVC
jgi:hypothetical protein